MGKASFLKIEDESGLLQIYVARDNLSEGFYNDIFKKTVEVGDIIEVSGYPFVTNKGELSLHVHKLKILTKAISPLPEKFHGITDKELDQAELEGNTEVKDKMNVARSWYKVIVSIAGDNILNIDEVTEQPLKKVLNFMALQKEKVLEENQRQLQQKRQYDLQRTRR